MDTHLTPFNFILVTLAAYYVAEVVTTKPGPFDIFARSRVKDKTGLLACIWCFIPYAAALVIALLFIPYAIMIVWILASCGAAMMLRSYTGSGHG